MRAVIDIAAKDLRQKVRDRSAVLLAVVAPFMLAALFSLVLGGVDEGFHARWGVVDLDGGELAEALRDGPLAAMEGAGVVTLTQLADDAEARKGVEDGSIHAAIVIPGGFSDAARGGSAGEIDLIVTPDQAISGQVAASVLTSFASRVEAVRLSVATVLGAGGQLPDAATTERLAAEAAALPDPVVIVDEPVGDRTASMATYFAAAMAILFVFLAAQFGVASLLAERREGTLSRMLSTPIRPATILAGKVIVAMVLAVTSMSIIAVGTTLLLGASWGDPLAVAGLAFSAGMAATGVALLVVGFARTEEQAGNLTAIVAMVLAVVGGSFFPLSQAPEVMVQLSLFTPHAWFLRGINDLAGGGDVTVVAAPIAVLAALGLVTGAIGLVRARRVVVSR